MEQLIACRMVDGNWGVRPIDWGGIWDKNGSLDKSCNNLAEFAYEQDAKDFVSYRSTGPVEEFRALKEAGGSPKERITIERYRRAFERLGRFGRLFVDYTGSPRGPAGRSCCPLENEVLKMPVLTDVDGGAWIPVNKEALYELVRRYKMLSALDSGREALIGRLTNATSSDMARSDLERCPFCGEEAELEDWTCAWESGTTIRCVGCNAGIVEGVVDGDGWHDRAVEKWNRRTAAHARIAELELEIQARKANSMIQEQIIKDGGNPFDKDKIVRLIMEKTALQSQYKEAMNLLEFAMEQLDLAAR